MDARESLLAAYEASKGQIGLGDSDRIRTLRRDALESFADLGFPRTSNEDWRYTSVSKMTPLEFKRPSSFQPDGSASTELQRLRSVFLGGTAGRMLVFLNGRFLPELSSFNGEMPGVETLSLAAARKSHSDLVEKHLARYATLEGRSFSALNTAFHEDGAFVHVAKDVAAKFPIHLVFVANGPERPMAIHPRNLIVLEAGSSASVIQSYVGLACESYLTNVVTETVIGENAHLEHFKIQQEGRRAFHISDLRIDLARHGVMSDCSIAIGGSLARNDVTGNLRAEGAECHLNGLYMVTGNQHVDNHTTLDHVSPHTISRENYKGILDASSRAVFNGKVIVRPDAQKTDSVQSNKNLLLSENAVVDTKPQLEIFADDVKCAHGAAIGELDEDALFYLRARGIPRAEARALLTHAFASEIVDRIRWDALRRRLDGNISLWLSSSSSEAQEVS